VIKRLTAAAHGCGVARGAVGLRRQSKKDSRVRSWQFSTINKQKSWRICQAV